MHRLTFSNVVAALALFVALGGTATAATALRAHSVGARELKRNAVTSSAIRDRAVGTRDLAVDARPPSRARIAAVVTDTMTSQDVLTALSGAVKGQPGDAGATGPQGPQGPAGTPGVTDVVIRQDTAPIAGQSTASASVRCEAGERALGGGGQLDRDGGLLSRSFPLEDGAGWAVVVANQSTQASTVRAYVICAKVGA